MKAIHLALSAHGGAGIAAGRSVRAHARPPLRFRARLHATGQIMVK